MWPRKFPSLSNGNNRMGNAGFVAPRGAGHRRCFGAKIRGCLRIHAVEAILAVLAISAITGCAQVSAPRRGPNVREPIVAAAVAPLAGADILHSGRDGGSVLVMVRGVVGSVCQNRPKLKKIFGAPWPRNLRERIAGQYPTLPILIGLASASADGRYVAALSLNTPPIHRSVVASEARFGSWQIWSVARKKCLLALSRTDFPSGHEEIPPRGPLRVVFTDGGKRIAACGHGGLYFFNFNGRRLRLALAPVEAQHAYELVPNQGGGNLFAALCALPGRVEIWDGAAMERVVVIPPPPRTMLWVAPEIHVSLCGRRCAVSWGNRVDVYDAESGRCVAAYTFAGACRGAALSAGGKRLAVCVASVPRDRHVGGVPTGNVRSHIRVLVVGADRGPRERSTWLNGGAGHVQLVWTGRNRIVESTARHLIFWSLRGAD